MLELEAGRGKFFAGPWHAWRREKAARELALGPGDRAPAGRDRAARAVRDPVPGRDPGPPGPVAGQEAGEDGPPIARRGRRRRARVRVQAARAQRPGRVRARGRARDRRRPRAARRRRAVARARRARLAGRAQRGRQDHADRDARRAARAGRRRGDGGRSSRASCAPATTSSSASSPSTPRSCRPGTARTVLEATTHPTRLDPEPGAGAARPLPVLRRGGREAARGALGRRAPAAVAGHPRPVRRQRADPRRADQPPRPREPRGARAGARRVQGSLLLVSHDRALLDAVGKRTVAIEDATLHSYVGGWPEYVRRPRGARAGRRQRPSRRKPAKPRPRSPRGTSRGAARRQRRASSSGSSARSRRPRPSLRALEEELSDPAAWSTPQRTRTRDRAPRAGQGARSTSCTSAGSGSSAPVESAAPTPAPAVRRLAAAHATEPHMPSEAAWNAGEFGSIPRSADPDADAAAGPGLELRVREVGYAVRAHAARHRERLGLDLGGLGG